MEFRNCVENRRSIRSFRPDPVRRDDLAAALMEVEHLLGIQRLELRPLGTGCYADPRGDLQLRRNAVAYLGALDLEIR